ncbi:RING finger protein 17 isoform X2 [Daktulosphaira vitifoliae]|uniref:RING finger protein 17 isoform X2 n=1 Tax=Daktulosphaira vitifoliae TaxID=58002 RepID=UPI0021A9AE04|nr:RING finger protein 17 isoform X2 [Daktulosphaira vitifoliae]
MSRMKVPCCSRCKMNYYVGDINGPKIPLLLKCGHDMCRNCVKFLYKRNSEVTCFICEKVDNFKFDNENKINLPVHYYKIGQVYWLTCKKQMEIHRSISNLKMTDCPTYSSESVHDVCDKCQRSANCFCHHCNVVFCYSCFDEVHTENQVMSKHIPEMIDKINIVLNSEPKCDQHFKTIEFICVTCEVNICSYCLVQSHKTHDVSTLEIYNSTTLENLTKYSNKGSLLLGKLKSTRDNFNIKMQTIHHSRSKKKLSSLDEIKHTLSLYMSTVIGALQNKEEFILDLLEQTDYADINSMNTIINQLNGLIGDLQSKLNLINHCISQNKLSSNSLKNAISDVKNMLDTSYLIAKKDKPEPSIKMDDQIFDVIQKCFTIEVDTSDTFLLRYSPDLPEKYQVNVSIDINDSDLLRTTLIPSPCSSVNSGSVFSHYSDVKNFLPPVHDLVPIKEIHKNVVEPVVVTAVNTPSNFYLQLLANNSHLNMINEELKKSVNTKSNVVDKIEKNNVMYAVLTTNQYWCRCIISHIYEENGNMLYTVHCIDYGFLETVTSDKIRSVPTVLRSIPPLAYNCALYDLKPKATTGWSNDAYKLFTDLMFIKSGTFYMYPMETRGERIEVDVVWKDIYPLSIRDALFFLGYGSYEYYVNQSLHQKLVNSVTIPVSIQLEKGERYPVSLSHFVSPNEFYFHVIDKSALLEDIMNRLQKVYKPTEKEMQKSYLLYTPQIGMAVAARFSMDDTWYRAKITSIPEPRMVTVFYVDYGNSETLPWDQLRVLDEYFIKISPQALRVSLEGIIPSHNGIECSEWSIEANAKLMEMLSINHFVADSLYIFVNDVIKDGVHKVTVYNQTSRGEFCINNKLVSLGYALPTQSGAYIYNSNKNKRRPIKIKKLPVNTRNRSDSFDSDDTSAFVSQRSVIESENHIWNDKKSDSPGIEMLVIRVESPDKIILKPVQYNPTKLTDRLNKEYSKNISNKETKSNWVENDRCALFIKKFGNWYRGKILKLDENKKKATVYFYDIDETIDNVFTKSLFELEDKLFKEKCEILHCKLNNLTPLGTSNGQWAKFTSDQLSEELKKYSSVYLNKKGKEGDVILGEIWIKDLVVPKALEPIRTRWININRFMVEQGLAMWSKKIMKKYGSTKP